MSKTFLEERSGEFACHYTTLATVCKYILPTKKLRFSPFEKTNDPRENKERVFSLCSSLDTPHEVLEANQRLNAELLKYSKLFCTTEDAKTNPSRNTERCFGRPRMWAQYGENHQGICLAFHRETLTSEIEKWYGQKADKGKVKYTAWGNAFARQFRAENGDIKPQVLKHIREHKRRFFFTKDLDWEAESEYRWVIRRCPEDFQGEKPKCDLFEYIPFGNSLKAIIMGVDCDNCYIPSLQNLAQGIPIFKLAWNLPGFEEDFSPYIPHILKSGESFVGVPRHISES
ncbi:MAG TPA: DUF2971 domain-containing protein [Blastocatellia bacterium]|nr:DUF2971 domain-containing protein [Blastocatellia bacterium]